MGICCLLRNHRGRMSLYFVLARPSEDPPVSVTGLSLCLAEPRVNLTSAQPVPRWLATEGTAQRVPSATKPPLSFVTIPSLCCPEPSSTLTCRLQYSNIRYFFDVLNRLEHLKGTSCFVVFQLHHPIIFLFVEGYLRTKSRAGGSNLHTLARSALPE